jgi:site-specific DNA recombinase
MQTDNKRAVIYCRVSTKEQVEEGNSLVTQEKNCREYAFKNGFEIAQVFIEQGESAKTADRTELQKLFSFCANKKNGIQAIIAYKIDRISRNTDDYSQIRILLKRYGVEIRSTSEYFENTPAGRFMENIIANVAQFDNDVRTERSIGGMISAMHEGRYVWYAPIGYINTKVNGKVNIIQTEKAPLIKTAFEQVVIPPYSVAEVRKRLAVLGLCNKNGKPLTKSYFYTLLKNEIYAGWICKFGERHKGNFEPIISEELYNAVQRALKRKTHARKYNLKNQDFLLRRFIAHPNGEKLTGSWSKGRYKKYAYYRFTVAKIQWTKQYLEHQFFSFLNRYSFDKRLFAQFKKEVREQLIRKSEKNKTYMIGLLEQQELLKGQQRALAQKSLNGILGDNVVKDQMDILEDKLWEIHQALQIKENKTVNFGSILQHLNEFLIKPGETFKKMPFYIQLKLLWFEFPQGVIYDGTTFRTAEICSIFKLNSFFLAKPSSIVPLREPNNEHIKSSNYPRLARKEKALLWEQIGNDLVELDRIMTSEEEDIPSIMKNQAL